MDRAERLSTVAASLRSNVGVNSLKLLSPLNEKTPKGEALGYLTAILYLAPATLAGGKTVCPHSTEACREGCLFHAGRGRTPRVFNARIRRTEFWLEAPDLFLERLADDLEIMERVADQHGMRLAIRLNGTSDVLWERDAPDLFTAFPRARFYDYTRAPLHHRRVPGNWHLTWSLADRPAGEALPQFITGHSVAVVVPEERKRPDGERARVLGMDLRFVDGDLHDLRFLDPAPAIVQLRPKGRLRRGGPMVRPDLLGELMEAAAW